jgi:hypothetical protein
MEGILKSRASVDMVQASTTSSQPKGKARKEKRTKQSSKIGNTKGISIAMRLGIGREIFQST